jgi:hypothetical protein
VSNKSSLTVTTMGIDIGKSAFHVTVAVPIWPNASISPGTPACPVINSVSSSLSISKSSLAALLSPAPSG